MSSCSRPAGPSCSSAATAASATSSASRNGSTTSPTGSASSPASTAGANWPSVKFCANHEQRSTVQSSPRRRPRRDRALGALRAGLAAAGQQDDAPDAGRGRTAGERRDRPVGPGDGEVGCVGQVDAGHAGQRGVPGAGVGPVQPAGAAPGGCPHGLAPRGQALHDAAAGRAGAAGHQGEVVVMGPVHRPPARRGIVETPEDMRERLTSRPWTPSPHSSTARGPAVRSCCARCCGRPGRCASPTRRR